MFNKGMTEKEKVMLPMRITYRMTGISSLAALALMVGTSPAVAQQAGGAGGGIALCTSPYVTAIATADAACVAGVTCTANNIGSTAPAPNGGTNVVCTCGGPPPTVNSTLIPNPNANNAYVPPSNMTNIIACPQFNNVNVVCTTVNGVVSCQRNGVVGRVGGGR
jgi:hypothetical protein